MDYYTNQSDYDILGVTEDASLENIHRAKDRLKFGDSDDRAPFHMWAKIDEAYNVLSDPVKRREYDKKLDEEKNIYSNSNHDISSHSDYDDTPKFEEVKIEKLPEDLVEELEDKREEKVESGVDNIDNNEVDQNEYDLNFVSEFKPEEKEIKSKIGLAKPLKVALSVAGTLVPFAAITMLAAPTGIASMIGAGVVGLAASIASGVTIRKLQKIRLQKNDKPKKITKISTPETMEFENYRQALDKDINRLLSEPHNNYKLEISRVKYENQIDLLEKILEIKLNKKIKKSETLKHKLDVIATKMQLETAKQNLTKVNQKINEYEKEQGLSKVNKELIEVNQQLAEQKGNKSFSIRKLEAYQSKLLNKRNAKATGIKTRVVRSGKVYDSFLKAKDFVVSVPYIFKSAEQLDQFMEEDIQRVR